MVTVQILRKCLKTNKNAAKIKEDVHENCTFCNTTIETISHLFYTCHDVMNLWNEIRIFLMLNSTHFELSKTKILFGVTGKSPDSILNFTILTAKAFIWNCKYKKKIPRFLHFKYYFKNTLYVLKEMYCIKNLYYLWEPWEYIYTMLDDERPEQRDDGGPLPQLQQHP